MRIQQQLFATQNAVVWVGIGRIERADRAGRWVAGRRTIQQTAFVQRINVARNERVHKLVAELRVVFTWCGQIIAYDGNGRLEVRLDRVDEWALVANVLYVIPHGLRNSFCHIVSWQNWMGWEKMKMTWVRHTRTSRATSLVGASTKKSTSSEFEKLPCSSR